MTLRFTSEPDAPRDDRLIIINAVDEYNMQVTGDRHDSRVNIFARDEDGVIRGGILADVWGGWMHITFLWVDEALREQGHATRLLQMAEDEARAKGCRGVFLETFSFQARPFYERFGYQVFGEIADYPPGHTYYFLRKLLG